MRRGNAPGSLACFGLAYLSDCAGVWENAGAKRTGNGSGQAAQDLALDVGGFFVVIDCPGAGIQKGSLGHWAELGQAGHGAVQSSEPAIFNGRKLNGLAPVERPEAGFKGRLGVRFFLSIVSEGPENNRAFGDAVSNGHSTVERPSGRVLPPEIVINHFAQTPFEQIDFFVGSDQLLGDVLKSRELIGRELGKGCGRFLDEDEFLLRVQGKYGAPDFFRFLGGTRFGLFGNEAELFSYDGRAFQIEKE